MTQRFLPPPGGLSKPASPSRREASAAHALEAKRRPAMTDSETHSLDEVFMVGWHAGEPVMRRLRDMTADEVLKAAQVHADAASAAGETAERVAQENEAILTGKASPTREQALRIKLELERARSEMEKSSRLDAAVIALWPQKYHHFAL